MSRKGQLLVGLLCMLLLGEVRATIVLFGNDTVSYPSMDASFTPPLPEAGILGDVCAAEPLDGCSAFGFNSSSSIAFVVVARGECTFEIKVRNAQDAGFTAVIVFDKAEDTKLVTMSGNGAGVTTYALYVTKEAGEKLISLEGSVYILPGYKKKTWAIKWLIISVSLIVIVIVGALVTALCCIRQHILAEAEKEAYNEKLLHDDHYILNREFIPDDLGPEAFVGLIPDVRGPEALVGQDVVADTEVETRSDGPHR